MNEKKFTGLKSMQEKLKGYDVVFTFNEDKNGNISGTYEGIKKMSQSSAKITNRDIMESLGKINSKIEKIEAKVEKIDKIEAKLDLMLKTPTMQKEIDHNALNSIDSVNK